MENREKITPVILGADMNAYSMAAALAEAEGLSSYCLARYKTGISSYIGFIKMEVVPDLTTAKTATAALFDFADKHIGERLLLIPAADWYVEVMEKCRGELAKKYHFLIPPYELWERLKNKKSFGELVGKYAIPYPKTAILENGKTEKNAYSQFEYPAVLKPADSTEYWRHPFVGMRKVYFPKSADEAISTAEKIFDSGYEGSLILQERIGGDAPKMSVLTAFFTREAKCVRAVLADVLIEENAPTAKGNYSALITRELDSLSRSLIEMLEREGYTGIANFDIIGDGKNWYVLECNTRQGRSSDYTRAAGVNLGALLLADGRGEAIKESFAYKEVYWHAVPHDCVMKYATDKDLLARANLIFARGEDDGPYKPREALRIGLMRRLYLYIHNHRERRRYSEHQLHKTEDL